MRINGIVNGMADASLPGRRSELIESAASAARKESQGAATATSGSALAEIFARYNVRQITPDGFSSMIAQLRQSGAIDQREYDELRGMRNDLNAAGFKGDDTVDLVALYSDWVRSATSEQASGADATGKIASLDSRRAWAEKLATMHDNADALGMQAVA